MSNEKRKCEHSCCPDSECHHEPAKANCGCSATWKCPEHRGVKIPVKGNRKKISIPPYWRGFLEAMGIIGILFLIFRIVENWK